MFQCFVEGFVNAIKRISEGSASDETVRAWHLLLSIILLQITRGVRGMELQTAANTPKTISVSSGSPRPQRTVI